MLAGSVDAFDAGAYKIRLARMLPDVSTDRISLSVAAASILVNATIRAPSVEAAAAAHAVLARANVTSLSAWLDVSVEDVRVLTLVRATAGADDGGANGAPPLAAETSSALAANGATAAGEPSTDASLAVVAVASAMGVLLLVAAGLAAFCAYQRRHARKRQSSSGAPMPFAIPNVHSGAAVVQAASATSDDTVTFPSVAVGMPRSPSGLGMLRSPSGLGLLRSPSGLGLTRSPSGGPPSSGPPTHGPPKVLSPLAMGVFNPRRGKEAEGVVITRTADDVVDENEMVKI